MTASIEIMILASLLSAACAIPGVFLLLRGLSMLSDAISHAILLGIVLMFFVVKSLHSPWLIIAAALCGLVTVFLIEWILKGKRLKQDAAIALVFPCFFALGLLLINLFARDIHLDQDAVLLGEIAFAPFNRWQVAEADLGPIAMWQMGAMLVVNAGFAMAFYKELKVSTFDKNLALTLGFSPLILHVLLMSLLSVTTVLAFDAVGAILVVAFMIAPAATASLLSQRLSRVLLLALGLAVLSALSGYGLATLLDVSIAGAMATMCGVYFVLAFFLSPTQGLLVKQYHKKQQRLIFSAKLLTVQLLHHENSQEEAEENTVSNLSRHMGWSASLSQKVLLYALAQSWISKKKDRLYLSDLGRQRAKVAMTID
eukprot:COSAG01_NODE_547_length_15635_cov_102.896498_9_plen_370_part_00